MKSNLVIAACGVVLFGLAVALVAMTAGPVESVAAHTATTAYDWYYKPTKDGSQPVCAGCAE